MKVHAPAVPALAVLALLAFSSPSAAQCAPGTLAPSSGVGGDQFGFSVDIDDNGMRAVVGAPKESSGLGAAYVYDWDSTNETWVEVAKLTGTSVIVISQFGYSVAVSGNRIVVGAPFSTPSGFGQTPGTAFVFERQVDGTWSQVAELTDSSGFVFPIHPGAELGKSVDIQGDTIIVGLPLFGFATGPPAGFGAVDVYEAPFSGLMTEFAHLDRQDLGAASINNMQMGEAVGIDGNTIVAGAPEACGGKPARAFVFELLVGDWSAGSINKAVLTASDPDVLFGGDGMGKAVDISGNTIVVGNPIHTLGTGGTHGKVYIYEKSSALWVDATEDAALTMGGLGVRFGRGVAIDEGTGVLLVGDPLASSNDGRGHVYQKVGGVWTLLWSLSPTVSDFELGSSAAISGSHKLFGGPSPSFTTPPSPHGAVWDWNTPLATGSATVRTGDLGLNPLSYASVNAPTIGKNWNSTVDIATPLAISSMIAVGLGGPWSGTAVSGLLTGEFLIQLVPEPIVVDFAAGAHSLPIPPFCNLIGVPVATQALTFLPGDIRLTNALDLVFGSL